jgi:pyridoxamine 5'-phosphate oxidase
MDREDPGMEDSSLPEDPIQWLKEWLAEAEHIDLPNPAAMTLCTVDPDGRPSARTVLLKGLDERGAVFHTNRRSRKGRALEANPRAALVFHWDLLLRQVTIEGRVEPVSEAESDAYFATRPRSSRLSAWASRQSEPVESRAALDAAAQEVEARFEGQDVPRPPYWGGYRVSLDRLEFWAGRPFRLHDRIEFIADGQGGWRRRRLFP